MGLLSSAVSLVGGLLGGKSGGSSSGGTTTSKSEPWSQAQPWLRQNITQGQNLQRFYQINPFNQQQQAAYKNLASGTDYMNRLTPGLLEQFSQSSGFNRNNPSARPAAFNFAAANNPSEQMAQSYGGLMQQSMPKYEFNNVPGYVYMNATNNQK